MENPVTTFDLLSELKFPQKATIFVVVGDALTRAQGKTLEMFYELQKPEESTDKNSFLKRIIKAVQEGNKVLKEILNTNQEIQKLLDGNADKYIALATENNLIGSILALILKQSKILLHIYIDDYENLSKKNLSEMEMGNMAQKVAENLAKIILEELQTSMTKKKLIEHIKESLLPGMLDPDRLALY
ncbi:MAG: hypothetical protein WC806_02870 [Candidatus Gracilibacteria bacterium]|jgi:hypothetical protein